MLVHLYIYKCIYKEMRKFYEQKRINSKQKTEKRKIKQKIKKRIFNNYKYIKIKD